MKKCWQCRESKPDNSEYFRQPKSGKKGFVGICKACQSINQKVYRDEHKDEIAVQDKIWGKMYRENNRESINAKGKIKSKIYREKNIEAVKIRHKIYSDNHKVEIASHGKLYRQTHHDLHNVNEQRRKAKKRNLLHTLTIAQWNKIKKDFNNECAYCGEEKPLTQEHFIAVNRGGEYAISNIVPTCQGCNSSKGAKSFSIWYPEQTYYNKQREVKILKYLGYKNLIQQLSFV